MRRGVLRLAGVSYFVVAAILVSCRTDKPDPHSIGVWASTSSGLVELRDYGSQEPGSWGGGYSFRFDECALLPLVNSLSAFFVNLPGANVPESKLFALSDLDVHFNLRDNSGGPAASKPSIEVVEGSLFRLSSQDLATTAHRYAAILISMPMGTADRLYAVQIAQQNEPVPLGKRCIDGIVTDHEVLVDEEGFAVALQGGQDGGAPFFGPGHNGEVTWDVQVGDHLRVVGEVYELDEHSKSYYRGSMKRNPPIHGVFSRKITILKRKP